MEEIPGLHLHPIADTAGGDIETKRIPTIYYNRDVWGSSSGVVEIQPSSFKETEETGTLYEDEMLGREVREHVEIVAEYTGWNKSEEAFKKFNKNNDKTPEQIGTYLHDELIFNWAVKNRLVPDDITEWRERGTDGQRKLLVTRTLKMTNEYTNTETDTQIWIDTFKETLADTMKGIDERRGNHISNIKPESFKFYMTTHTPLDTGHGTDFFIIYKDIFFPFDLTKNTDKLNTFTRPGKGLPLYIDNKNDRGEMTALTGKIAQLISESPVWQTKQNIQNKTRRARRGR